MRSCLDLDLVDVECDEDRIGERSAPGSYWAHSSACRKKEPSEVSVVVAVVGGARPPTDWLGNVVVPADEPGIVHVEGLSSGVGVDVRREADLEASPLLTRFPPGIAFAGGDSCPRQQHGRREVVPPCVSREVRGIESVPAEVATECAEPGKSGAGVTPGVDQFAIAAFDPYVASIEHRLLILLREAEKDDVLFRQQHPDGHVGHSVSGEARAQETTESAVGGKGGHGAPPFKAAMGDEDLVEQSAHACKPPSTVARTRGSPSTLARDSASSMVIRPAASPRTTSGSALRIVLGRRSGWTVTWGPSLPTRRVMNEPATSMPSSTGSFAVFPRSSAGSATASQPGCMVSPAWPLAISGELHRMSASIASRSSLPQGVRA